MRSSSLRPRNALFSSAKNAVSACGFHSENASFSEPLRDTKILQIKRTQKGSFFNSSASHKLLYRAGFPPLQGYPVHKGLRGYHRKYHPLHRRKDK